MDCDKPKGRAVVTILYLGYDSIYSKRDTSTSVDGQAAIGDYKVCKTQV